MRLVGLVACALLVACGAGIPQTLPEQKPLSANETETYARRHLESARALRDEGRLEAAARVAARGLELRPDEPQLQRLRAEVLRSLGRNSEADAHLRVATALSPPPPPVPDTPLDVASEGVVVTLLPPPSARELANRVPREWPSGAVAMALGDRIRTRLPGATIRYEDPDSVAAARAPLAGAQAAVSIRVDRAFCGDSIKDGRFAVAWLRIAVSNGAGSTSRQQIRKSVSPPLSESECREEAIARAFEVALATPEVAEALARPTNERPAAQNEWPGRDLRTLYPGIGEHLSKEIEAGRAHFAVGDMRGAAERFRAAAAIDPEDLDTRAFLDDVELSLAFADELASVSAPSPETLASVGATAEDFAAEAALVNGASLLRPAERERMEARLADEKRLRNELLSALAVLDEDRHGPTAPTIAALRPAPLPPDSSYGVGLARSLGDSQPIENRLSYTPDGTVLARYYFVKGAATPILREEDADDNGRPDRWVAYQDGSRSEVWEDRTGSGAPDLHLVFANGGEPLVRLEVDADNDGQPERIFRYHAGLLATEDRDTNGDGRHDLFERFDDAGALAQREEDLNGDGAVDIRTRYSSGRLVRREILDPDVVTEIQ